MNGGPIAACPSPPSSPSAQSGFRPTGPGPTDGPADEHADHGNVDQDRNDDRRRGRDLAVAKPDHDRQAENREKQRQRGRQQDGRRELQAVYDDDETGQAEENLGARVLFRAIEDHQRRLGAVDAGMP